MAFLQVTADPIATESRDNLRKIGHWRHLIWHFIIVVTSQFAIGFADGGLTILIPFYTQDVLQQNQSYSSTLLGMIAFGNFLCHSLTGVMVAHSSSEYMILIAAFIHFFIQLLLSCTHSFLLWCILCFCCGLTQSMTFVSIEAYVSYHIPARKRGRFMTYQVVACRVAAMFGAYSNGLIAIHTSIQTALRINACVAILFALILLFSFIPPNYRNLYTTSFITSFSEFRSVWTEIGIRNRFKRKHWFLKAHASPTSNDNSSSSHGNNNRQHYCSTCRQHLGILLKLSVLCFGQLYTRKSREFILTFQAQITNMNKQQITNINTFSYVPDIAVFMIPGYLMDRFGRKYSLVPSLLCLITASVFISFTQTYTELCLVAFLLGLGDGLANGSLNTIASDVAPTDHAARAKFIGVFFTICAIPTVISPIIIGNLASLSLFYASMSSSFFASISLLWTIFVLPETSRYQSAISLENASANKEDISMLEVGGASDLLTCELMKDNIHEFIHPPLASSDAYAIEKKNDDS